MGRYDGVSEPPASRNCTSVTWSSTMTRYDKALGCGGAHKVAARSREVSTSRRDSLTTGRVGNRRLSADFLILLAELKLLAHAFYIKL